MSSKTKSNMGFLNLTQLPHRTSEYLKANRKRMLKEDLNKNQQLDWSDVEQKWCGKHKRNYHFKCESCHP